MKNVADRSLVIGAVLVGLIVAAAMWFLAISPKLSSAQAAREATVAQNDANDILETTVAQREKDAAEVPNYTRELYAIRDLLPPTEDIPSVRQTIDGIVASEGLVVELDTIGETQAIVGGLSLAAQMEAVGLTSEIEGMIFTTLFATPITFEVVGPPANIFSIFDKIQNGDHRYFSVTNFTITPDETSAPGNVRASITMYFFTLDYGIPGITVRPPERPWPGTEDEQVPESPSNPFESLIGPNGV